MQEPIRGINLGELAAYGAVAQGAMLSGADHLNNVLLVDVNPNTLWFETIYETLQELIPRNKHIPYVKRLTFSTAEDNQTRLAINIYEGEGTTSEENLFLGTIAVTNIPESSRGFLKIEVLFEIDANSILTVSAKEEVTDIKFNVKFHKKIRNLFPGEIKKMKKDAEKFAENDKTVKEIVDTKNSHERFAYSHRNLISDKSQLSKKFSEDEKNVIHEEGDSMIDWIESNPRAALGDIKEILIGENSTRKL